MHLQAIVTKFHGPTNFKGARVSAKASAGKVMVDWDHRLDVNGNHSNAALALAEKMGWGGHWVSGGMPSEDGDVFVCVARETAETYGPNALPCFEPAFSSTTKEG